MRKIRLGQQEWIALLAIVCIFCYLVLRFLLPSLEPFANFPLFIALGIGGTLLVFNLLRKMAAREFESDLLAGLSIVTAVLLGEYLAGTLVVLMLSGGESIESYAIRSASRALEALAKRAPTVAHRQKGDVLEDISVDAIAIGDILQVFPHEICPVDGDVREGDGIMDESFLTGEPFLISKAPGSNVLSGAVNGDVALTIQATKRAIDSRYAKIMQVMQESEQKRPHLRRLADELGAWYTPIALAVALAAWYFSGESVRFLSVLVIATPCPLLIAIPVAIIGSISLCGSRGILIKNPAILERIDKCKTMIFDKTGTLTYGKPCLVEQVVFPPFEEKGVLQMVASLEKYSKHPLAGAILDKASEERLSFVKVNKIEEPKGQGLNGIVEGHNVVVTNRKNLDKWGLNAALLPQGMGLECVILIDGALGAYYRFHDSPRSDSTSFISHLSPMHGFKKIMIVSGDREEEVQYLANYVGISEVYAGQTPEEKVRIVQREVKKAETAYLGDGINDAPALVAATVGIAFGQNSDVTAEAAGAVVMDNTLERVDELLHIGKRMRQIGLQSALGGMLLSILGMLFAAFGYLPPVAGAIVQEMIDVAAILNAMRTIWRPEQLSDMTFTQKK